MVSLRGPEKDPKSAVEESFNENRKTILKKI